MNVKPNYERNLLNDLRSINTLINLSILSNGEKKNLFFKLNARRIKKVGNEVYLTYWEDDKFVTTIIKGMEKKLLPFLTKSKSFIQILEFLKAGETHTQKSPQFYEKKIVGLIENGFLILKLNRNSTSYKKRIKISRTILLNSIIIDRNFKSYLEIGVSNPGENFDQIKCQYKTGVDPLPLRDDIIGITSDAYFKGLGEEKKFDLIFIDGLHHADQVLKDIENSLVHLNSGGYIVCHDMLPESEDMQMVPRRVGAWTGDCWKAWAHLRMTNPQLKMNVINADYGIGMITRGKQRPITIKKDINGMDYNFFNEHKERLMNILYL